MHVQQFSLFQRKITEPYELEVRKLYYILE